MGVSNGDGPRGNAIEPEEIGGSIDSRSVIQVDHSRPRFRGAAWLVESDVARFPDSEHREVQPPGLVNQLLIFGAEIGDLDIYF